MSENLALNLIDSAKRSAEQPAVRLDDTVLSYGALDDLTARVAGLLRARGVAPGDRVGLMLPNVPQFAVAYYGILRAGAIVVPMNVLLKRREVASTSATRRPSSSSPGTISPTTPRRAPTRPAPSASSCDPGTSSSCWPAAAPGARVADKIGSDTAVILYTSGTTGRPKGAELTHANLRRNAEVMTESSRSAPRTWSLGALPCFTPSARPARSTRRSRPAHACLSSRASTPAPLWRSSSATGSTSLRACPRCTRLCCHADADDHDVSSCELCVSGGAALPVEVLRAFEEGFGCIVLEGYGLSETSPVASFNHPDRERKPGSIGTPIEGVEMKLVDETAPTRRPARSARSPSADTTS